MGDGNALERVLAFLAARVAFTRRAIRTAGRSSYRRVLQSRLAALVARLDVARATLAAMTAKQAAVVVSTTAGVAVITTVALMGASSLITGEMQLNNGASTATTSTITIDSAVNNAVEMRVGPPAVKAAVGYQHVVSIDASGALWAWGYNYYGQFGDGTNTSTTTPIPIGTGSDWAAVSAANQQSAFLKQDGTLYMCGQNTDGQLGIGSTTPTATLAMVGAAGEWESVSCGSNFTLGVKKDGTLWAWGDNGFGQIGIGGTTDQLLPIRVGADSDWASVSAGYASSYAIKDNGTLWSWGWNNSLELGYNTQSSVPAQVAVGTTWKSVSAGQMAVAAIKSDGSLYTWGNGANGQLGDGTTTARTLPTKIDNGPFVQAEGRTHVIALKADGSVWTWGSNQYGQVGDGTSGNIRPSMTQVMSGATSVVAGEYMSAAFTPDGMYSWGISFAGSLGGSYEGYQLRPLQVSTGWQPYVGTRSWQLQETDGVHTVGVTYRDAAGDTTRISDQIFYDSTPPSGTTIVNDGVVATKSTKVFIRSNITNVTDMRIGQGGWFAYASNASTTVPSSDGTKTISVDYRDEYGRILNRTTDLLLDTVAPSGVVSINGGDSTTRFLTASAQTTVSSDAIAMRIEPPVGWKQVVVGNGSAWGIRSDGTLHLSGSTSASGDGLGSGVVFRPVGDGLTWRYIAVPQQSSDSLTVGIRSDGTLWGWGTNYYNQLADGTTTSRRVASRIGVDSDWKMAATSGNAVSAIKTNGTLWSWGYNSYGECGLGTTATANTTSPQSTPKQVMAPATWKGLAMNGGWNGGYSVGLMADGTLWTWGYNNSGQLGNGTTITNSKPQRPTGTAAYSDWTTCTAGSYTAYAIRSNGDLWAWGDNWYGQIGDGTATSTAVAPKLVGTGYKSVSAGSNHVFAVKSNGELWGWGYNSGGQLGDGSTVNKTSPTRLGTRSDWVSVSVAGSMNSAMTADGRLWAWGPGYGNYADSLSVSRTTPVAADWFAYNPSAPFKLTPGNGVKSVNVIVRDLAGNEATLTDTISLDTSAAAGSMVINGDAAWSSSATVTVDSSVPNARQMCEGAPVKAISANNGTSGFVRSDGVLLMSGNNYRSKLGTAGAVNQSAPVMSTGMRDWAWVGTGAEHTLALTPDGTLYSWGGNIVGQLGTGDTLDRTTPYLVGVPGEWAQVSVGAYHNLGIKKNGSMWSWGSRYDGALGDSTSGGWVPTPQQIGTTSDWKCVSAGAKHSLAVRNNGELWAWGTGTNGQLGLGSGTPLRYYPTKVGTATDWATVSAGTDHSLGTRIDGSLYAWGDRYRGQIGEGNIALNSPTWGPLKIEGSGFTAVSAGEYTSYAIRSDGSLWGWGYNNTNLINSYTTWGITAPNRIGTAGDWAAVDAGNGFTVAMKTDGTVWTWGSNTNGELGNAGTGNDPKVPSQIMARSWVPYAASSAVKIAYPVGNAPVTMGFRDIAGNITWLSDSIRFDLTPPNTLVTGVPVGWSTTPVNLQFQLSQPEESGLAGITYRINGGAANDYTLLQNIPVTAEGTTVVSWFGTDVLGNVEASHAATISVDTVKPVTTSTLSGGWVATSTVALSGADVTSGIRNTFYSVDGGSVTTYTAPFTAPEGAHDIRYWSVDVAGNVEDTITVTSKVDLTAPTSQADGVPTGWSDSPATVALSATDPLSGGVVIRYSIDGAAAADYDVPLVIGNGIHQLAWSAVDVVGNREATQTATIKVDTTVPTTTSDSDGKWHAGPVTVSLDATDTLSGVAASFYRLDHGIDTPYLLPFTVSAEGTTAVDFWSTDAMGNTEPGGSTLVRIDYTAPVTTISGVPSVEVTQAVSLVLSASDGGSGIAKTYFRLNGAPRRPYVPGQTALVLATEGTTTIEYWSEDAVANAEAPKSATVHIKYPSSVSPTSKSPTCVGCHGAPTGPRRVRLDFSVGDVVRSEACPKCHVGSLAGSHPFHNATANCGAFCHVGWGSAMASAIPNVSTAYGSFTSTTSAVLSSDELHVIHSSARWPADADKDVSRCGSCHAVAACDACHSSAADPIDPLHANHSATGNAKYPAVAPLAATKVGYGVPNGDQTQLTTTMFAGQCATSPCHNVVGVRATDAVIREDYSHPANPTSGVTTNTVTTTGVWKAQFATGFSAGRVSYSTTVGGSHSISFTGQRVAVVLDSGPNRGMADVYLDGVLKTTFDAYSATAKSATAWESGVLGAGTHTITVKVKGTKNVKSTMNSVAVDYYRVWPQLPGPVSPLCASCHPTKVADHGYDDADHVADSGADIEPTSGAACSACHSMDLMTEHERLGSSSRGGTCVTCHQAPRGSFLAWNQTCAQGGCHTPETTQERHADFSTAHTVTTTASCTQNCHESRVSVEHGKAAAGRTPVACVTCHNSPEYEAKVRAAAWDKKCTACHAGSHAPELADNRGCFECHGSSSAAIDAVGGTGTHAATGGDHEQGYSASAHGGAVPAGTDGGSPSSVQCEACHNHNEIATSGVSTSFRVTGPDAQSALCFECHSASGDETRTVKPNTWNRRDVAVEFARRSHHPYTGATGISSAGEATVTAFVQSLDAEFDVDTLFQMATPSLLGARLRNETHTETPAPRQLMFFSPGWNSAFDQYDPATNAWNTLQLDPPEPGSQTGFTGYTAVVVDNAMIFTPGQQSPGRYKYTPPAGSGDGVWSAMSSVPFGVSVGGEAVLDAPHRKVYYFAGQSSATMATWDIASDTWGATGSARDASGTDIGFGHGAGQAYSPEADRLFVVRAVQYFGTLGSNGRLYYLNSPSTAPASPTFTDTGVQIANPGPHDPSQTWGRMERITRGGHDYLIYVGMRPDGVYSVQVIGNLTSATPTVRDIGLFPWGTYGIYGLNLEWDGADALYLCGNDTGRNYKRISIPADPLNDAWPTDWDTMAASPNYNASGQMAFLTAQLEPYDVTGYYSAGTVSVDVQAPPSASAWGTLEWTAEQPASTSARISVQGWNGSAWVALPGMGTLPPGSTDLSSVSAVTYPKVRLTANLSTVDPNATPALRAWSLSAIVPADEGVTSLACASCHNSHIVKAGGATAWDGERFSDPLNTKTSWSEMPDSSTTAFCLSCHSTATIRADVDATTVRPYDIGFRDYSATGLFSGWSKGFYANSFTNSGHYTTTGTKALCETCHDPHGSDNANLTAWTRPAGFSAGAEGTRDNTSSAAFEENLCLQCHGNGVTGTQAPGAQDIATPLSAAYRHDQTPAGAHSDTETVADVETRRHAECVDCHDPHSARAGVHAEGTTLGQVLIGATAVQPEWNGVAGETATKLTPTRITGKRSDSEAMVCFKCHSSQRTVTRGDGSTYISTDLTKEFNPNNPSYHNVFGLSVGMRSNFSIAGTSFTWGAPAESAFLKSGWHYDSTVTCSDCHTSGSMSAAKGPHGSSAPFLIDPAYGAYWPEARLDRNTASGVMGDAPIICSKCHDLRNSNNVHNANWISNNQPHAYGGCSGCHIAIPHGWKRPRMLVYASDPAPYNRISLANARINGIYAVTMRNRTATTWSVMDCQSGCTSYIWHRDPKANTMP